MLKVRKMGLNLEWFNFYAVMLSLHDKLNVLFKVAKIQGGRGRGTQVSEDISFYIAGKSGLGSIGRTSGIWILIFGHK